MLHVHRDVKHAYHLFVIKVEGNRTEIFQKLRKNGIGVNVHYIPVHLHSFYRKKFHTGLGLCPVAEAAYEQIISLPMFPGMTDENVREVIEGLRNIILECQ